MNYSANTYRDWHTLLEQGTPRATFEEAIKDARDIMKREGGDWTSWARMSDVPHEFEQNVSRMGYRPANRLTIRIQPTEKEAVP